VKIGEENVETINI